MAFDRMAEGENIGTHQILAVQLTRHNPPEGSGKAGRNIAGSSNATTKNSNRSWDWGTMKAGVGGDFTITPLYVSLRMGS